MTNKDFFSAVALGTMNDEIKAFAKAYIEKSEAKNSADKAKKDAENAPIIAKIHEVLADGKTHTASDIATRLSISTPKVSALVKKIDGIKVDEVTVNKRIVNGYHI